MTRPSALSRPIARVTVTGLTWWRAISARLEGSRSPGRRPATAPRSSAASVAILLSSSMRDQDNATATRRIALPDGFGAAALGVLAFSFTFPATSFALRGFGPYTIGVGRAAIAAVLAVVALRLTRAARPYGRQWVSLGVVAGGVVFGFPVLSTLAL